MSDVSKTIELIFQGTDQTSGMIRGLGGDLDDFGSSLDKVASPIANATQKIFLFEAAIAAAAAALAAYAIGEAIKFQTATTDLAKVLDTTDGSIDRFTDSAIAMSNKYGEAGASVLQSVSNFKQAGFAAADALELTRLSLVAVGISELDAAAASEAFVRILLGFGEPASEAARLLDVLNEVSNVYATDSAQLAEAMARVAPVAQQMGFSFEETAGVLTPMIEIFQDSERTSTAFNAALLKLVGNSKPVTEQLAKLGVSQLDLNGKMKSGKEIFFEVAEALKGVDENMKLTVASELVGIEAAPKLILALSNTALMARVTETAFGALGSAEKEYALRSQDVEQRTKVMHQTFHNFATLLGLELLPEYGKLIDSLGHVGLALQKMLEKGDFDPLIAMFNGFTGQMTTLVENFALNFPTVFGQLDFSVLQAEFAVLKTSLGGVFTGIDLNTPEGLRKALQLLIDLGANLTAFTSGAVDGFKLMFAPLLALAGQVDTSKTGTAAFIGQISGLATGMTLLHGPVGLAADSVGLFTSGWKLASGAITLFSTTTNPLLGLLGKAGLVGAVGLATYELTKMAFEADGTTEWLRTYSRAIADFVNGPSKDEEAAFQRAIVLLRARGLAQEEGLSATEAAAEATQEAADAAWEHMAALEGLAAQLTVNQIKEGALTDVQWESVDAMEQQGGGISDLLNWWQDYRDETREATAKITENASAMEQWGIDAKVAGELAAKGITFTVDAATKISPRPLEEFTAGMEGVTWAIEKGIPHFTGLTQATEEVATAAELTAEKQAELALKTEELAIKWEELASQERMLVFEVLGDIRVAEIQAQAEQVKAAFESIGVTITSTGELMGELAGLFAETTGFEQTEIRHLMEEENARRQEALDLQKQLVEAQVKYLEATTERLASGDAMITITGDGLEPELKAFMFKILESIQIEATAQGQSFLLGLT